LVDKQRVQGELTRRFVGTNLINLGLACVACCRSTATQGRSSCGTNSLVCSRDGYELPQRSRQLSVVGLLLLRVEGRVVGVSVIGQSGCVYDRYSLVVAAAFLCGATERTPL
jgi:hypothetical protein